MTNEKARDFFSAYYEGSLEPGLCVSFEQKLKADSRLKDEYTSFARTMGDLGVLASEEIEIPEDLHERITARLDRHIYDRKRSAQPAWSVWIRNFAFAAVGAIAVFGAILALNNRGGGPLTAGIASVSASKEKIGYAITDAGINLTFAPATPKAVIVTDAEGKLLSRSVAGDDPRAQFNTLLSNPLMNASVFGVSIEGSQSIEYFAIPGKERSSVGDGEGTLVEMAKAVADYYKVPVHVDVALPTEKVSWTFATPDVVTDVSRSLGSNFNVTLLKDGMLEIERK